MQKLINILVVYLSLSTASPSVAIACEGVFAPNFFSRKVSEMREKLGNLEKRPTDVKSWTEFTRPALNAFDYLMHHPFADQNLITNYRLLLEEAWKISATTSLDDPNSAYFGLARFWRNQIVQMITLTKRLQAGVAGDLLDLQDLLDWYQNQQK